MSEYKIAVVNSSSFGQIFKEHWSELEKIGQVDRFVCTGYFWQRAG